MPQTPLKECSVTPDPGSKLSVSSGSAVLPLLRVSLESGEDPALAGFAILVVSQVHTPDSMGGIVLIRMTEGQMCAILRYCKRCISSLGIGIVPLEKSLFKGLQLAVLTGNIFQELSTCHILKTPYVSQSPGTVLRITG